MLRVRVSTTLSAYCLGAILLSSVGAAMAQTPPVNPPLARDDASGKVSVLDGGNFISVEARDATVSEIIEALGTRLNVTFSNTERIDMARIISGTRVGNIQHILTWLVPAGGFVVFYREQKNPDPNNPGPPERVGFLEGGSPIGGARQPDQRTSTAATDPDAARSAASARAGNAGIAGRGAAAPTNSGGDTTGKPDVRDTGGVHELLTLSEQLRASTPETQLDIDRQQRDPTGQSPTPNFLGGPNNVANTSLQQQMQRSQALATSQIQALQQALSAACRGAPGAPC